MQIYLLKDLAGQGKKGEIINVNDGYARNFVIKNGYGKVVDNAILSAVRAQKQSENFHKAQDIATIHAIIGRLRDLKIRIGVKVGANGKLFGAVTGAALAADLGQRGFDIDKKQIVMESIHGTGEYKIKVKFNYNLMGEFTLEVFDNAN
jgi:large subunit ribosomal protein L9